jgi:hypothetical protein
VLQFSVADEDPVYVAGVCLNLQGIGVIGFGVVCSTWNQVAIHVDCVGVFGERSQLGEEAVRVSQGL